MLFTFLRDCCHDLPATDAGSPDGRNSCRDRALACHQAPAQPALPLAMTSSTVAETSLSQVTQGRGQPPALHSSPGGLREPLCSAGGSQHGPGPQKQEGFWEGDEMLLQIWQERGDKSGPAANGAKRTVPGEQDRRGTAGRTRIHHCRHFSHCSSRASVSMLVLEPEQTRSRSEWYKGEGNGKSFELPRFCAIHFPTSKLASTWAHQLPALATGMRERAGSFPLFL